MLDELLNKLNTYMAKKKEGDQEKELTVEPEEVTDETQSD